MYVVKGIFFSTNTINICIILSTIYMFIPVSVCGGRAPRGLLCPKEGSILLFKMALSKGDYQKPAFEERQTIQ